MNSQSEDKDIELAKKIAQLPPWGIHSLARLVDYLDTPVLEELIEPNTTVDRLYELFAIWSSDGLFELLTVTMLRILKIEGGIGEEKIREAERKLGL